MTVLRFTQVNGSVETEIGLYSVFAIHPTSLGTFNVKVSGDNKGWAAKFVEDVKPQGYVAAFANANAGDVSPNVNVAADWSTRFDIPAGSPKPEDAQELADNIRDMKAIAKKQSDHALALLNAPMAELNGRIASRCKFVDMSNVVIGTKRTAKAAIGVSFAAGSHEDGVALATFDVLGFDFSIKPGISEGTNATRFAAGRQQTQAIAGGFVTNTIANDESLLGVIGSAGLLTVTGKLDNVRADALARSWVFGIWARALFPSEVESHDPQPSGGATWEWNVPASSTWPASYVAGHGPKPIIFPAGLAELKKRQGLVRRVIDQPLVPHKVPLQVIQIGSCVMAAMPFEFTTVAGRRLKAELRAVFGPVASHVALVGYANDYAFYVTTPEEYAAQHYEGASTLYGPHTLVACLQETRQLATALKNGTPVSTGTPDVPRAIYYKT
jgi:hypothetical protein